jgi:isocitrate lyase
VLVPTSTHTSRLISGRFQLDLLESTMLLIARTDSVSARLISSTVDADDHEFILGTTTRGTKGMAQVLAEAEAQGASGSEIDKLEKEWLQSHEMCTFNQGT